MFRILLVGIGVSQTLAYLTTEEPENQWTTTEWETTDVIKDLEELDLSDPEDLNYALRYDLFDPNLPSRRRTLSDFQELAEKMRPFDPFRSAGDIYNASETFPSIHDSSDFVQVFFDCAGAALPADQKWYKPLVNFDGKNNSIFYAGDECLKPSQAHTECHTYNPAGRNKPMGSHLWCPMTYEESMWMWHHHPNAPYNDISDEINPGLLPVKGLVTGIYGDVRTTDYNAINYLCGVGATSSSSNAFAYGPLDKDEFNWGIGEPNMARNRNIWLQTDTGLMADARDGQFCGMYFCELNCDILTICEALNCYRSNAVCTDTGDLATSFCTCDDPSQTWNRGTLTCDDPTTTPPTTTTTGTTTTGEPTTTTEFEYEQRTYDINDLSETFPSIIQSRDFDRVYYDCAGNRIPNSQRWYKPNSLNIGNFPGKNNSIFLAGPDMRDTINSNVYCKSADLPMGSHLWCPGSDIESLWMWHHNPQKPSGAPYFWNNTEHGTNYLDWGLNTGIYKPEAGFDPTATLYCGPGATSVDNENYRYTQTYLNYGAGKPDGKKKRWISMYNNGIEWQDIRNGENIGAFYCEIDCNRLKVCEALDCDKSDAVCVDNGTVENSYCVCNDPSMVWYRRYLNCDVPGLTTTTEETTTTTTTTTTDFTTTTNATTTTEEPTTTTTTTDPTTTTEETTSTTTTTTEEPTTTTTTEETTTTTTTEEPTTTTTTEETTTSTTTTTTEEPTTTTTDFTTTTNATTTTEEPTTTTTTDPTTTTEETTSTTTTTTEEPTTTTTTEETTTTTTTEEPTTTTTTEETTTSTTTTTEEPTTTTTTTTDFTTTTNATTTTEEPTTTTTTTDPTTTTEETTSTTTTTTEEPTTTTTTEETTTSTTTTTTEEPTTTTTTEEPTTTSTTTTTEEPTTTTSTTTTTTEEPTTTSTTTTTTDQTTTTPTQTSSTVFVQHTIPITFRGMRSAVIAGISTQFKYYNIDQDNDYNIRFRYRRQAVNNTDPLFSETDIDNILSHGCHCGRMDDNANKITALGGPNTVDEMDSICKDWQSARNCVFLPGGSCFASDPTIDSYVISMNAVTREIDCSDNVDPCVQDVCYIDALYVGFILGEFDNIHNNGQNFLGVPGDSQICPSGFGNSPAIGCVGTAPNVEIVRELP